MNAAVALAAADGPEEGHPLVREAHRVLGPASAAALDRPAHHESYEGYLREGRDLLDALLATVYPLALEDRTVSGEFLAHFMALLLNDGRGRLSTRLRSIYGPEDLVQSVVADLFPRMGDLEFRSRGEYLRLLMMRLAWKGRRRGRTPQAALDGVAIAEARPEHVPGRSQEPLTPLSEMVNEEDEQYVVLALAALEPEDQDLLRWSMEGWTRARMAEVLECSVPTLRKRLERARQRLRWEIRRLQGEGDDRDEP